jgi:hypothetical protein
LFNTRIFLTWQPAIACCNGDERESIHGCRTC